MNYQKSSSSNIKSIATRSQNTFLHNQLKTTKHGATSAFTLTTDNIRASPRSLANYGHRNYFCIGQADDELAKMRYPFAMEDRTDLKKLISVLGLAPHPEGGFFRETYRSENATAIYYLLTADTFSEMHRLDADEVYHFYSGDPVEILRLFPDGTSDIHRLGNYLQGGEIPQLVVPKGVWQGSRLCTDGSYALMGTTMSPGFRFEGYEQGKADELIASYPVHAPLIKQLTRT